MENGGCFLGHTCIVMVTLRLPGNPGCPLSMHLHDFQVECKHLGAQDTHHQPDVTAERAESLAGWGLERALSSSLPAPDLIFNAL